MSKVSHLPKNVPNKELPFKFKIKGSTSGHPYSGDFVVKVPSVREMGKIGIELARLNEGVPLESLDSSTATLHNAIAFLKVTLMDAPSWFTNSKDDESEEGMDYGLDTDDINVPVQVFKQAEKLVKTWHKALRGQPLDEKKED